MGTTGSEPVLPATVSPIRLRRRSNKYVYASLAPSAAHQSELQRCELIFGACLLITWVGAAWSPAPLTSVLGFSKAALALLGIMLAGFGTVLLVSARRQLAAAGQRAAPGIATTRLISEGVFRYTRHPTYLSYALLLGGIALLFDSGWALLMVAAYIAVVHLALIQPEERYLKRTFGQDYRLYARRVRCWL